MNLSSAQVEYIDQVENELFEIGITIRCTLQSVEGGNTHEDIGFGKSQNKDKNLAYKEANSLAIQDSIKRVSKYFEK